MLSISNKLITLAMRESFFPNMSLLEIRDMLESNGLNRHMAIESESNAVIPYDKWGNILLHEKNAYPGRYGFIGGAKNSGETSQEAACRELKEESGILANPNDLIFLERVEQAPTIYPKTGDEVHYFMDIYLLPVENWPLSLISFKGDETLSMVLADCNFPLEKRHKNHIPYMEDVFRAISQHHINMLLQR